MKKRPSLKPGDVVRASKKANSTLKRVGAMTVIEVPSDSTDGRSKIKVAITSKWGVSTMILRRHELWYTGYNIADRGKSFSVRKGKVIGSADGSAKISHNQKPIRRDEVKCSCGHNADSGTTCWWCGAQN